MRILLVYCHPVPESFAGALCKVSQQALIDSGHEVRLLDLYRSGFDPIMSCEERRRYHDVGVEHHPLPEHVEHLRWAEGLLFVYPTWWFGQPAMLKGWLERVWSPDVAFEIPDESGRAKPLLNHIRWMGIVTTCGASRFVSYYVGHPGMRTLMRGVGALCAPGCKKTFLALYKMDTRTQADREKYLKQVENRLRKI